MGVASTYTARLLWAACRPSPDVKAVIDAVDSGADLSLAVRTAIPQRVGPLLWAGLREAGLTDRLGSAGDLLRHEFDCRHAQAPLLLPLAVAAAVEPLTRAGLEPVVFKGPALAVRYPEPGLRPMDDIDLLLPVGYDRGVAALEGAGWKVWQGRPGAQYDTVLYHPRVPHLPLELHRRLDVWRHRSNHLTAVGLWRRRQLFDCFGTPAFGLPPEEELVALAAHAGKPFHQFQRLIWSVDLAVVVAGAGSNLDWDRVAHLTRRHGCSTVVAVALGQARRLGATVPDKLLVVPSGRTRSAALAPLVDETWPLLSDRDALHRGLRFVLSDTRRSRVLLAMGEITKEGAVGMPRSAAKLALKGVRRRRHWKRTKFAANEGSGPRS